MPSERPRGTSGREVSQIWRYTTIVGARLRLGLNLYQLIAANGNLRTVRNLATNVESTATVDPNASVIVVYDDASVVVTGEMGHDVGEVAQYIVAARLGGEVVMSRDAKTGETVCPVTMSTGALRAHLRLLHDLQDVAALGREELLATHEAMHATGRILAEGIQETPHRHEEI